MTLPKATTQFHNKSIKNQICIKTDFRIKKCVQFHQKQIPCDNTSFIDVPFIHINPIYIRIVHRNWCVCAFLSSCMKRREKIDLSQEFWSQNRFRVQQQYEFENSTWLNENSSKWECIEKEDIQNIKFKKVRNLNTKAAKALAEHCVKLFLRMTSYKKVGWQHIKADTKRILFISAKCKAKWINQCGIKK